MGLAGTVIVLNGPPSAGKRAIIARLQETADAAFMSIGIDVFYKWMIPELRAGQRLDPIVHRRYLLGLHATIAAHARAGCNVLVDHTLLDAEWHRELAAMLAGLDVLWIEVRTAEHVLRAREAAQGARPEGAALELLAMMVRDAPVDLGVDGADPARAAADILHHLRTRSMRGQPLARWVADAMPLQAEKPGRIIALVGSSSAGKSTLCRALQAVAEARTREHFLYMGIDTALDTLPARYFGIPFHPEQMQHYEPGPDGRLGFSYVAPGPSPDNPSPYPQQQCGPVARACISGQLHSIAAMSRAGLNVVGDHIWIFRDWYDEARALYEGLPILWVSVSCSDDVVDEHERRRGDRLPGWALGQRAQMYKDGPVDVIVDTGTLTPEQEAERILAAIGL
jgi:chloramphenicol 3-O phosphotransferase